MKPVLPPDEPFAAFGPAPSLAPRAGRGAQPDAPMAWVYMMRCADGSLYSGWTNDLARRQRAHKSGHGARYTRAHHAETLAYAERCENKSGALKREAALKKLSKPEKEALAAAWQQQSAVIIRPAVLGDAAALAELYGWYVRNSTATFQYEEPTEQTMREQIAAVQRTAPYLVAENGAGELCGYACAHPWRPRQAYSWDVETTIYCRPDAVGQGVAKRLYTALLALLKRQGYYNAIACITHPNPASAAFHKAMGFVRYGLEPRTGYKYGRWLGASYWLMPLHAGTGTPKPVRYTLTDEEIAAVLKKANAQ